MCRRELVYLQVRGGGRPSLVSRKGPNIYKSGKRGGGGWGSELLTGNIKPLGYHGYLKTCDPEIQEWTGACQMEGE